MSVAVLRTCTIRLFLRRWINTYLSHHSANTYTYSPSTCSSPSTFSLCGAFRTVPHLLNNVAHKSLVETMTTPADTDWGDAACGMWVQLFIFSKIPELWDTFYIVARKRPLLFLHWYHHVTVLLYCWHSYATEAPQALYFVAMNYSVHGIMYGYYCLMALKMKPKWIPQLGHHLVLFGERFWHPQILQIFLLW